MRILISGSTGLIGSALVQDFTNNGDSVFRLVRDRQASHPQEISWFSDQPVVNISQFEALDFEAVVHLSGANVAARRWKPSYKREIFDSRIYSTQTLAGLFSRLKNPPKVFLCASATGIYGNTGDKILTEDSSPGDGFLAETCIEWEAAAQAARDIGIRVANLRFGMVLSPRGGALAKMLPFFRLGLGGRLGSGNQWISWVSLDDVISAVFSILHNERLSGPVNVVAPNPVTNAEFTRTLARAIHRFAVLPIPEFALRGALGEIAGEGLLASTRVIPAKLIQSGFRFTDPRLAPALEVMFPRKVSATLETE